MVSNWYLDTNDIIAGECLTTLAESACALETPAVPTSTENKESGVSALATMGKTERKPKTDQEE